MLKVEKKLTEPNKGRDKRSHDERISELLKFFYSLKNKAICSGKKTDASAAKVLELAKVNRTYFYAKEKLKDEDTLRKYHDVRDDIQSFQENFDSYCENSVVTKSQELLDLANQQRDQLAKSLITQQKQLANIQNENISLKNKQQKQSDNVLDMFFSKSTPAKKELRNFGEVQIVSPDEFLWKNGQYCFNDERLRRDAWERAKEKLKQTLQRPLPMRVYVLVGPPCSGKSFWAESNANKYNDMHSVVIDATNLKYIKRLEWLSLINKFRSTERTKLCVVVFLTSELILQSRNNKRNSSKKIDDTLLLQLADTLEFPDLQDEDFDELIVVRAEL